MGFVTRLLSPTPKAFNFGPADNFWYEPIGGSTTSGVSINPQTAMAISTVYACVRIISGTLAMLPLVVHQRLPTGGKERATQHPLFEILHTQPNVRQTSFQFREMMMMHALLRGNGYAEIIPGARGFADQLLPLNPDRVRPFLANDETIHYEYQAPSGRTKIFLQDEVFHIANLSDDGVKGLSTVALARNSFGLAKATEEHGSRHFSQGQVPAATLETAGKLSTEAQDRLRDNWKDIHGGVRNTGSIAILEEGLTFKPMAMSNEDSQFLETRMFQVEEIASWFGVPLSLLQHTEKSTSWGTGITELTLGFVKFTMQPWFTRWEQEIQQDLILDPDLFFAEFVLEGLLKGDPKTRSQFYNIMIRTGVFTRNEVRIIENLNPLDGLDEPLDPAQTNQSGQLNRREDNTQGLALKLATDTAARMVRIETREIEKAAKKYADDPIGWATWVGEFYEGYQTDLMEVCKFSETQAFKYIDGSRAHLLTTGVSSYFEQPARAEDLASLMMENHEIPTHS